MTELTDTGHIPEKTEILQERSDAFVGVSTNEQGADVLQKTVTRFCPDSVMMTGSELLGVFEELVTETRPEVLVPRRLDAIIERPEGGYSYVAISSKLAECYRIIDNQGVVTALAPRLMPLEQLGITFPEAASVHLSVQGTMETGGKSQLSPVQQHVLDLFTTCRKAADQVKPGDFIRDDNAHQRAKLFTRFARSLRK